MASIKPVQMWRLWSEVRTARRRSRRCLLFQASTGRELQRREDDKWDVPRQCFNSATGSQKRAYKLDFGPKDSISTIEYAIAEHSHMWKGGGVDITFASWRNLCILSCRAFLIEIISSLFDTSVEYRLYTLISHVSPYRVDYNLIGVHQLD